jgi:hypothetical protein
VYFYSQLMFSSWLLNDTVITEDNIALDDSVINDAMKNLCKKASMTMYYSDLCLKELIHSRKPIVSIAGVLCEFQATK